MSAASNIFLDNSVETMSSPLPTSERLFPPPTRETHFVLWIIEEEPIPTHIESCLIYENIESTVRKQGYCGHMSIKGFLLNPKEPSQEYSISCRDGRNFPIFVESEGNKGARFNMMLIDIIYTAFLRCFSNAGTANFLVLSSNKNFGQDTKFPRVREAVEKRGINVAVAHPDTFKIVIDRSGSSQTEERIFGKCEVD